MKFVKHSDKPIASQLVSNRGEMKTNKFEKIIFLLKTMYKQKLNAF